jgi:hypothetical protein
MSVFLLCINQFPLWRMLSANFPLHERLRRQAIPGEVTDKTIGNLRYVSTSYLVRKW